MIEPVQKCLLVEAKGKYKNFDPTEDKWGTSRLEGIVLAIAKDVEADCKDQNIQVGDRVYFSKYEDNASYDIDGKTYVLIKLEEIRGRASEAV